MVGIVLIIIGFLFLARNLGLLGDVDWNVVWPAMLIIAGVLLMTKHSRCRGGYWGGNCWHGEACTCPACKADHPRHAKDNEHS